MVEGLGTKHEEYEVIKKLLVSETFRPTRWFLWYRCSYELEDLVQECLKRRGRESCRHEKIYQAVQNAICDVVRARAGRRQNKKHHGHACEIYVAGDQPESMSPDPEHWHPEFAYDLPVDDIMLKTTVEKALAFLKPDQWWLIYEYFWFGSTLKTIGRELGITESAAGIKLAAALGRLKRNKRLREIWA